MVSYIIVFAIVANIVYIGSTNDLPSYFPRCNIDDPNIDACIVKASDDVRKYVKKGVPELDIPSMDPLIVPEIKTQQGTSAVNYKMTLVNATISGLGDYKFTEFRYDPKTLTFHGTALFKHLSIESDYEVEGRILLAPIQGKGHLKGDIVTESSGILNVTGKLVTRNGEEYYDPIDVKAKIDIKDVESTINGLFGGNEQLARATNDLINEHSSELVKEITPAVEKVAEQLLLKMMTGISKNVPYKKLLPPSH